MKQIYLKKLLAGLLALALCASMPVGLAEDAELEAPVEELEVFVLGEAEELPEEAEEAEAPPAEDTMLAAPTAAGLALNSSSLLLGEEETFQLAVTLNGGAVSGAKYISSAPKVVAVSSAGKLTAKKTGSAVITATYNDYTVTCAVDVAKAPKKVTLDQTKATLGAGQTLQLAAAIPAGSVSGITWKSGKTSVATVDQSGLVTARAKGTATITATACNGKKASCKVTVSAAPTGIRFDQTAVTLSVGQRHAPKVTVTGSDSGYDIAVTGNAVSFDNGTLTALRVGTAQLVASTYNGLTARLSVTVVPAPKSISLSQNSYAIGEKDALTLTPIFDADVPATLTFTSSAPKIAQVTADGVVTGKKAGRATITVTTHNGLTASCAVQVYKSPSKVTLNQKSLTLNAGETFQLEGKLPENSISTLTWKSDKPGVAAVDGSGLVTALSRGSATITVTTANKKKATCKLKIVAPPTRLTLSKSEMTLKKGKTDTVTWSTDGEGDVKLAIQDPAVAEIKKTSGSKVTIRAKAGGSTVLTASTSNGLSAQMTINVEKTPTYLRLPEGSVSLTVGQTYAIRPDTDALALTFTSGKGSVAAVSDSGVVTAVGAGSAEITVQTTNKLSAKLKVTVTKAPAALSVSPASLVLAPYEYRLLKVTGATGTVTYSTSDGYVAYVSKDGVVTGIHGGECTITAKDGNGRTAACRVTVVVSDAAPAAPAAARLSAVNASTLEAAWDEVIGADGYRVYLGTSAKASEASLYQSYDGWTRKATILGVTPDSIWHIFVTAYNSNGESPLSNAAHALIRTPSDGTAYRVSLNYADSIMLSLGAEKTLSAAVTPSGYVGGYRWASSSGSVTLVPQGSRCAVVASRAGEGRVTVTLDNGMAASLYVRAVDTADLSDANFTAVQRAVMQDEALMNADEGGNVIWDMVRGKLIDSGMKEANASALVDKVSTAEALFRNIYVCALGAYDIVAEATRDKRGVTLGVSQFLISDNTLYMVRSASSTDAYAYTALHETGHAVDYSGSGKKGLLSENSASTAAILADVRQILLSRMDAAIDIAGVRASRVSADKVADAVLDYRTLLDEEAALSRLNGDERQVYYILTDLVANDMNAALPMNNGTMVWDAIEGATNFAVSGKYGHSYLLDMPQYKDLANYYFYDSDGTPAIAAEPWSEFFSANIMQDAATLAVNLAWLPKTCQYFGETLAPKLLDALKGALAGK